MLCSQSLEYVCPVPANPMLLFSLKFQLESTKYGHTWFSKLSDERSSVKVQPGRAKEQLPAISHFLQSHPATRPFSQSLVSCQTLKKTFFAHQKPSNQKLHQAPFLITDTVPCRLPAASKRRSLLFCSLISVKLSHSYLLC